VKARRVFCSIPSPLPIGHNLFISLFILIFLLRFISCAVRLSCVAAIRRFDNSLFNCCRFRSRNQAPSYFHWAENKPVTTNQIYGFWQHDFPNQPHPERPPNFFRDRRPFDVLGFPCPTSGKHEWDLTASHCRSPPLAQWRPTRRFCLAVSRSTPVAKRWEIQTETGAPPRTQSTNYPHHLLVYPSLSSESIPPRFQGENCRGGGS